MEGVAGDALIARTHTQELVADEGCQVLSLDTHRDDRSATRNLSCGLTRRWRISTSYSAQGTWTRQSRMLRNLCASTRVIESCTGCGRVLAYCWLGRYAEAVDALKKRSAR